MTFYHTIGQLLLLCSFLWLQANYASFLQLNESAKPVYYELTSTTHLPSRSMAQIKSWQDLYLYHFLTIRFIYVILISMVKIHSIFERNIHLLRFVFFLLRLPLSNCFIFYQLKSISLDIFLRKTGI